MESTAPDADLADEETPESRRHLVRELVIFAVAAVAGFLVVPLLIWTVGHSTLGPYNPGGPAGSWRIS